MSGWVAGAVVVGAVVSSEAQKDAAKKASRAQTNAANSSIAEQQRQFDQLQELLSPYVQAGNNSLSMQQNLLGLNGNGAQSEAINGIMNSSQFNALSQQGESAILQNASATGGLRGGNVQAALAQFRPQLLNQLIQQQYQNLGGITSLGQNAAAGVGNAGMQSANAISNQLGQIGAAQAGAAMAGGRADASMLNGVMQGLGTAYARNTNNFGGSSSVGNAGYTDTSWNNYNGNNAAPQWSDPGF